MNAFFSLAISCVMFNCVNLFLFREVEGRFFLWLELWDKLSFFLFSHLLIILEKSYFLCEGLDLFFILFHKSLDRFYVFDPFAKNLLCELNWVSSTDQTTAQEFVSVFFDHFLEINVISSLNFLWYWTLLLILHEIKLIIRFIFLLLFFIINVIFFPGKRTNVLY